MLRLLFGDAAFLRDDLTGLRVRPTADGSYEFVDPDEGPADRERRRWNDGRGEVRAKAPQSRKLRPHDLLRLAFLGLVLGVLLPLSVLFILNAQSLRDRATGVTNAPQEPGNAR